MSPNTQLDFCVFYFFFTTDLCVVEKNSCYICTNSSYIFIAID
jgi:hypothetical protein